MKDEPGDILDAFLFMILVVGIPLATILTIGVIVAILFGD
jgi:hypothetical protein